MKTKAKIFIEELLSNEDLLKYKKEYDIELKSGHMQLKIIDSDENLNDLCGFGNRQNKKRNFLFISKVLGKHYPVSPKKMKEIHLSLAKKIQSNTNTLFVGFAETAIGLSAGIYNEWSELNQIKSYFVHTTRYQLEKEVLFKFEEEHSHATNHIVYNSNYLKENKFKIEKLVLIDDEMTTGKTSINFLKQFIKLFPNVNEVDLVCLTNWMGEGNKNYFKDSFNNLKINFISLLDGEYVFTKNESFIIPEMPNVDSKQEYKDNIIIKKEYDLRDGVNNNLLKKMKEHIRDLCFKWLKENKIKKNLKTVLLGTGEFSYEPYLMAQYLQEYGVDIVYQSTTRSPILIGNTIESKIEFKDNYEDDIPNYVYNIKHNQYEQVIVVYETKQIKPQKWINELNAVELFIND